MKLVLDFMKTMFRMSLLWRLWVAGLMGVNLAGPLFFPGSGEAWVVLVSAMAGGCIMMAIFRVRGYVRLLGMGHILWVPMLPWLVLRLDAISLDTPLGAWILAVIIMNGFSLLIDASDVLRYFKGEREPWLTA